MQTLKELTKEAHRSAERTSFMQRLIKKNITPYQYYVYVYNQLFMYLTLEYHANRLGIFNEDLFNLQRAEALHDDEFKMRTENDFERPPLFSASLDYVDYIEKISNDKDKLFAHIYVRHMGDLSGGQIIKKLVPGPTNLYEFEGNIEELKTAVRSKLHLGLEEESKVCFAMVQKFLEELEEYFGNLESSDRVVGEN